MIFPIINPGNVGVTRPMDTFPWCREVELVPEAIPSVPGHPWLRACTPKCCIGDGLGFWSCGA